MLRTGLATARRGRRGGGAGGGRAVVLGGRRRRGGRGWTRRGAGRRAPGRRRRPRSSATSSRTTTRSSSGCRAGCGVTALRRAAAHGRRARGPLRRHGAHPARVAAERAPAASPPTRSRRSARAALEAGLAGGLHRPEHGGQGWSHTTWALVEEQLGRATNALSWHIPNAYNVLAAGTPEQIDRWLRPALRGEAQDAYAVTEALAGSDPAGSHGGRADGGGGWRIRGEKWFVTSGDVAYVLIVMAYALEGGGRRPTLFLVPADTPGVTVVEDPPFTHNYPHGHPTLRLRRRGRPGRRARRRGARATSCSGRGSPRSGSGRGPRHRGDDAPAGGDAGVDDRARAGRRAAVGPPGRLPSRSPTRRPTRRPAGCSASTSRGSPTRGRTPRWCTPRRRWRSCSSARRRAAAPTARCRPSAGRGYRRDNVAERFWRELRVDRIWEGTSEIQRLIVARSLERRGVGRVLR